MKTNILVAGYTGTGKTQLIQAICGSDIVPDSAIGHSKPETVGFTEYETEKVHFFDSRGMEMGQTEDEYVEYIQNFVSSRQDSDDIGKQIHIVWYCIGGDRSRVTQCDKHLIQRLFPVTLIVVTKNDIIRKEQQKAIAVALADAAVNEENIVFTSGDKKTGLDRLLKRSISLMPDAISQAVQSLLKLREKEFRARADEEANGIIWWGAGRAAAIAIVPIPIVDILPLIANEAYMIMRIGGAYGITVTKSMVTSLLGMIGASISGKLLASFFPFGKIPIAAGITYGVGKAAQAWFASGGELSEEQLRDIYKENWKYAKSVDWKKQDSKLDPDE